MLPAPDVVLCLDGGCLDNERLWVTTSLMFRLRYRHGERIPPTGPVLLVANHVSVLDPLACARLVFDNGRLPHFLAKQSVFKGFAGTLLLFFNLSTYTLSMFLGWSVIGIIFYYAYGYRRSHLANGTESPN